MAAELLKELERLRGNPKYDVAYHALLKHVQALEREGLLPHSFDELDGPTKPGEFSKRTAELLIQQRARIYTLTGQSITDIFGVAQKQFDKGMAININKPCTLEPSHRTQVAIFPDHIAIKNSDGKPIADQQKIIATYGEDLGRTIPDITTMMGNAADYIAVAYAHYLKTGMTLYQQFEGNHYIRTTTQVQEDQFLLVGYGNGINFHPTGKNKTYAQLYAAPLIIPARK